MPQLDFTTYPSQILWLVVSFLLLFFCVFWLFFPKLERVVRSRESKIKSAQDSAQQLGLVLQTLTKEIEEVRQKGREDALAFLAQETKKVEENWQEENRKLSKELQDLVLKEQALMEEEGEKMLRDSSRIAKQIVPLIENKIR